MRCILCVIVSTSIKNSSQNVLPDKNAKHFLWKVNPHLLTFDEKNTHWSQLWITEHLSYNSKVKISLVTKSLMINDLEN